MSIFRQEKSSIQTIRKVESSFRNASNKLKELGWLIQALAAANIDLRSYHPPGKQQSTARQTSLRRYTLHTINMQTIN